ncbi:MAG: hypothetical protein LBD75_07715 [Candidatus Peribacteria bacterium]|jgi:polysaccharide pyruvyl transferase WcaK-like protein|nr:hypothetical protein [Candidatus Peribacteria bacterium]
MDTSYFAYDWNKIPSKTSVVFPPDKGKGASLRAEGGLSTKTPYIIVNLNKNGERFLSDIVKDLQPYVNKGYTIYFVSIAKGKNTYYNDVQYKHLLEQHLENSPKFSGKFSEILLLDWEHNFAHFVHMLKNAELVISTRLHLFLLASFLGVQTKVYPYQRKILKMQEVIKSCKENLCEKIP